MSLNLKKKDLKAIEHRKAEFISKCYKEVNKEEGKVLLRSKHFTLLTQKRLENEIETGQKVKTGARYVLLTSVIRKLIFEVKDLVPLQKTLDGMNTQPFVLQLYNQTFRLKFSLKSMVRPINFPTSELEDLQAMIQEFLKLIQELEISE